MDRRLRLMSDDGGAFRAGAALVTVAGVVEEAGAVPITITGFAAEDEDPTVSLGDTLAVDVHPGQTLVQLAHGSSTFLMELWSTVQIEPTVADIGVDYGIAVDAANGAWYVDQDDETTICVNVVGIAESVQQEDDDVRTGQPSLSLVEVHVIAPQLFAPA